MADNMTAGKKLIDPAPIISKLADRALVAKGVECSLLRDVIDLLMAAEDVADIYVANNWVPVTERPPEERGCYFVTVRHWHDGEPVTREAYWNGVDWLSCERRHEITPRVTHWRLMPDPYMEVL